MLREAQPASPGGRQTGQDHHEASQESPHILHREAARKVTARQYTAKLQAKRNHDAAVMGLPATAAKKGQATAATMAGFTGGGRCTSTTMVHIYGTQDLVAYTLRRQAKE